jgi:hypothetical protein
MSPISDLVIAVVINANQSRMNKVGLNTFLLIASTPEVLKLKVQQNIKYLQGVEAKY